MHMFRVMIAKANDVAHFPRIFPKDVIDLPLGKITQDISRIESGSAVPSRSIRSIKVVTEYSGQEGCIDNILKRLGSSMVQLDQATFGSIEGCEDRQVRAHDYAGLIVKCPEHFLVWIPRAEEQPQTA